jgi:ribonuclease HII
MVGADGSVPEASAASIVAKVARDTYMAEVAALEYPQYGFDRHVGYGTALHIVALQEHGVTPIHRRSYKPIRQLLLQSDA